jgi:hypothetical protein
MRGIVVPVLHGVTNTFDGEKKTPPETPILRMETKSKMIPKTSKFKK